MPRPVRSAASLLRLAPIALFAAALLPGCFGSSGPCDDYCQYVCDCHEGEEGYDCDQCFSEYSGADPETQDECETSLDDLKAADDAAGHTCDTTGSDTAAR
jgi:hypothetical protein